MAKYSEIIDFDEGIGSCTVECDQCGKKTEVDTCDYRSVNEEIKSLGWVIAKINNDYHEFCCKKCLDKYKGDISND